MISKWVFEKQIVLIQILHRGYDGPGTLLFAGCSDVRQGVGDGGVTCERPGRPGRLSHRDTFIDTVDYCLAAKYKVA